MIVPFLILRNTDIRKDGARNAIEARIERVERFVQ